MPMRINDETRQVKQQEVAAPVELYRSNMVRTEEHKWNAASYTSWQGVPRTVYGGGEYYDYLKARRLSLTPTPRLCIQRLKLDAINTAWEIVPLCEEGEDKPSDAAVEHARQIFEWLFYRPNYNYEPFSQILGKVVDDILTHDAGVIAKHYGKSGNRPLVELLARDGALFTKEIDEYMRLGKVYPTLSYGKESRRNMRVGYWYNWSTEPKFPLEPHEVVYMSHDPRTDIPYGTSKMTVLEHMVSSCMYSEEFYENVWEKYGGTPPGIISPDISSTNGQSNVLAGDEYTRFKGALQEQLRQYAKVLVTPAKTQFTPLIDFNLFKWLETEDSYRHLIVALFNETPAILGWTKDIHKATDESQKSIYIQKGLWPLLNTIQWYMNTQVIADWFWSEDRSDSEFRHRHNGKFAGSKMDVMFRFKLYDPIGDKQQLEIDEKRLQLGLKRVNDVLHEQHQDPVEWGDINPLFLYGVQQWGQSYAGGAMDAEVFKRLTGGVNPGIKEIQAAIKPTTPEQPNASEEAFVKSRVQYAFSAGNVKAFDLAKTIRVTPLLAQTKYPQHRVEA